jgi:hypothetical protein
MIVSQTSPRVCNVWKADREGYVHKFNKEVSHETDFFEKVSWKGVCLGRPDDGHCVVDGTATEANAVYMFSRSCTATLGINESGTWNLGSPLDSWHWATSYHFTKSSGSWKQEHLLNSGWNSVNGVRSPDGWKAVRSIAQHTGEWWGAGASVGLHYWWDWQNKRYVYAKRTQATWCLSTVVGDAWTPPY